MSRKMYWDYAPIWQIFCIFLFLAGASLFGTLLSQLNEILQVVCRLVFRVNRTAVRNSAFGVLRHRTLASPFLSAFVYAVSNTVCLEKLFFMNVTTNSVLLRRTDWGHIYDLLWQSLSKETREIDEHLENYISFMEEYGSHKHAHTHAFS